MTARGARRAAAQSRRRRAGLGARLFAAHMLVIVAGAVTLGVVALLVAPAIFTRHLDRAGETDPGVREHADRAFESAFGIAWAVATAVAVATALGVSAFVVRRLTASVVALAGAADSLATGDYRAAVPDARLGGEFDRLTGAFTGMAARLDRTETVRRRLMADLAHEMRTPLTTLQAHVDGLEDGVVSTSAPTWHVMRDQLDRLNRLASDLSQLSAAEEHALSMDRHPEDLSGVVASAIDGARPGYRAKAVTLTLDAPRPVSAVVDAVRIQQVLTNLLDNALRHTPPGGTVAVTVRPDASQAVIEVTDTGDGIPAAETEAVFDRFHRRDTSRARSEGGSGLGLTIARAIVTDHGGTLTAHSDGPGCGSTFRVRIPLGGPP